MKTLNMKSLLTLLCLPLLAWGIQRQVIEIEVRGLTCPFCVYGLSQNLNKVPGVDKAEVDLDARRARIQLSPGQTPNIEQFKAIIRDAGFTPGEARVRSEELNP
ncbi:heavy-metal-associated domain-containing protein [Pseudomonas sp. V1]|uniref:heavy-metal-associated domain-containing protein n=1 Tax=Pseudomonas arcuscaelestis TaxID=2710591 RepID=UPI00193EF769|nr:heavy metal-associated domain-containing protein [Pseudomonas arcuscaelestis]MBM3105865.1 heavy-metal-associated domain-containing protein [Pseudomonas arcuscaelestis]